MRNQENDGIGVIKIDIVFQGTIQLSILANIKFHGDVKLTRSFLLQDAFHFQFFKRRLKLGDISQRDQNLKDWCMT